MMLKGEAIWGAEKWNQLEAWIQETRQGFEWLADLQAPHPDTREEAVEALFAAVKGALHDVTQLCTDEINVKLRPPGSYTAGEPRTSPTARYSGIFGLELSEKDREGREMTRSGSFVAGLSLDGFFGGPQKRLGLNWSGWDVHGQYEISGDAAVVFAVPAVRWHAVDFVLSVFERLPAT